MDSNAIMMRDDGNTLHSCLINSCCVLKVDNMNLNFPLSSFLPLRVSCAEGTILYPWATVQSSFYDPPILDFNLLFHNMVECEFYGK